MRESVALVIVGMEHSIIEYSNAKDAVLCFPCRFFSDLIFIRLNEYFFVIRIVTLLHCKNANSSMWY